MASAREGSSTAHTGQERVHRTLVASLPGDWTFRESLTLAAESGDASVIASSEPVSKELDSERYAVSQGELLGEFPGYREHAFEEARFFGGRRAYLRRFEWTPEDREPVMQIQIYAVEDGRGYTATATTLRDTFNRVELTLVEILQGLSIERELVPASETGPHEQSWISSSIGALGSSSELSAGTT